MIRAMRIILAVVLVVAMGQWTPAWGKDKHFRLLAADDYSLTLELVVPPFEIEQKAGTDGVIYHRLNLPGWARTALVGQPELPTLGLLIEVPQTGDITMEILENTYESLTNLEIYPVPSLSPSHRPPAELTGNEAKSSGFYPGKVAEVAPRTRLRGIQVARVMLYPFQWNPVTKALNCSRVIRLRLHFENPLPPNDPAPGLLVDSGARDPSEKLLKNTVINYRGPAKKAPASPEVSQLSAKAAKPAVKPPKPEPSDPKKTLRIEVNRNGIYRMSYRDLIKAGMTSEGIDPGKLRLLNRGNEVAIKVVSKKPAQFTTGDYLEFYGEGVNNNFTDTNVYWLSWGDQPGMRMAASSGTVTGQGVLVNSFYSKLHVEENHKMWDNTPGAPGQDYWFWEGLTAPAVKTCSIQAPAPFMAGGEATVRVCFRGYSTTSINPDHHTQVLLNGTPIGDGRWDGDAAFIQEMKVSADLLQDGTNTLDIKLPGDTDANVDQVYFNWLEVEYWRRFQAVADELTFSLSGSNRVQVEINGFSQNKIRLYDVSDPRQVKEVAGFQIISEAGGYKVVFEDDLSGAKTYCALTESRITSPLAAKAWLPANLKSTDRGADYILITAAEFLPAVERLCTLRRDQGLRVCLVAVEDIYNEFSYGLFDPQAIKEFLKFAYENWQRPAPTYVLLLGDANTDYRDYLGTGKKNRAPVHLSATAGLGVTPDDNWYVAFDADAIMPQMLIGRIPGSSTSQVTDVVNKILDYEGLTGYQPHEALFVADNNETAFEDLNEALIRYLPDDFGANRVYLRFYPKVSDATAAIIAAINGGMLVTNYVGHGDVTHWTGDGLFDSEKIPLLSNGQKLTFVVALDCLNGYFSQPYRYCLGEEFVIAPDRGAIASLAPSGLGYTWEHALLGDELFSAIFQDRINTLGVLATQSKINAYAGGATADLLKSFVLLGDPAARLKTGP